MIARFHDHQCRHELLYTRNLTRLVAPLRKKHLAGGTIDQMDTVGLDERLGRRLLRASQSRQQDSQMQQQNEKFYRSGR